MIGLLANFGLTLDELSQEVFHMRRLGGETTVGRESKSSHHPQVVSWNTLLVRALWLDLGLSVINRCELEFTDLWSGG
jgi:hypothetical protein